MTNNNFISVAKLRHVTKHLNEKITDEAMDETIQDAAVLAMDELTYEEVVTTHPPKFCRRRISYVKRSSRTTVDVHMFTVLPQQLSQEVGSIEGECLSACTIHLYTVQSCLQALVTDAPAHSRWLKIATKQSCI